MDSADVNDGLRATLVFLKKLTSDPAAVDVSDARRVMESGVSRQALEDAVMVAFCFNLITRLADSFGWRIPDQAGFDASGRSLLDHGYLMPMRSKPVRIPS